MKRSVQENTEPAFFLFFVDLTRRDLIAALMLLIGSAAMLYFGTARWPDTPDGLFHLQRVRALGDALRAGVLYPRWFPDFAFEYGHPILHYYAPAMYYPPALLELAGLGVVTSTRLALAGFFGLSGLAMYALLRLWVRIPAALAGAVVYLLFPYRLYDLFVRGALPEFTAFLWLPLLILSAVLVAQRLGRREGKRESRRVRVVLATLASLVWAGLILTHNLTALMAAMSVGIVLLLTAVIVFVDHTRDNSQDGWPSKMFAAGRVLILGLIPIILGVLLAAWYVVPALWESSWVGIGAEPASSGYLNHFVTVRHLFTWSALYTYPPAGEPTVPLPGWAPFMVITGLFMLPLVRKQVLVLPLTIGLVLTVGAIWLTTESSAFLWNAAEPVLGKLQFPWRWQSIVAVGVALLAGVLSQVASDAVHRRSRYQRKGPANNQRNTWPIRVRPADGRPYDWLTWLLSAAVIGYAAIYALSGLEVPETPYQDADITAEQMWAFDAKVGQVGMTWTGEFLPRWVEEQRWAIGREPSDGLSAAGMASVAMTVQPRRLGYLNAIYDVSVAKSTTLRWHRFYFPAWQVVIDGQPAEAIPLGNLGLLSVVVPAGEHEVLVRWRATPAVWLGRLLALLAWSLILIALLLVRSGRGWLAGWAVIGLVAIAVTVLPVERQQTPTQVGADYGPVQLMAASTPSAQARDAARVTLYWLVVEPSSPLTAFIHVVDDGGNVVAQHDGPLAGDYTPSERWLPGLLIDRTVGVSLPDSLPPGKYGVKAGVYEPGNAGSPLVPVGQDDPRVDIGELAVRP